MSGKMTYSLPSTGLYAGTGYVPPDRNGPPEMLKQNGGNVQTGFTSAANWTGCDQVAPPSVDFETYSTVPFPPCTPLSKLRKAAPSGAVTMRASWLLRTGPDVICTGVEKVFAPSRETETFTGEWVLPLNCTQAT